MPLPVFIGRRVPVFLLGPRLGIGPWGARPRPGGLGWGGVGPGPISATNHPERHRHGWQGLAWGRGGSGGGEIAGAGSSPVALGRIRSPAPRGASWAWGVAAIATLLRRCCLPPRRGALQAHPAAQGGTGRAQGQGGAGTTENSTPQGSRADPGTQGKSWTAPGEQTQAQDGRWVERPKNGGRQQGRQQGQQQQTTQQGRQGSGGRGGRLGVRIDQG